MWMTILAGLVKLLGPLVFDWLLHRLSAEALKLQSGSTLPTSWAVDAQFYPSDAAAVKADRLTLLHRVRDSLGWWQFAKKAAVDRCIEHVEQTT